MAWRGRARLGGAGQGEELEKPAYSTLATGCYGVETPPGTVWHGQARHGEARQGMARRGEAGRGF